MHRPIAALNLVTAGLAAWLVACRPAPSSAADAQAINALPQRPQAGEKPGQADSLAALVASDVIILPPNAATISGRASFADWVRTATQSMSFHVEYQGQEVVVSGDWAFDRGTYTRLVTPKAGGAAATEHGKYLWLLHREHDGTWQYARTIWNSDASAPPAP